jgi:hypothetical protein
MAVYGGILTSNDPRHQRWFILLGVLGVLLFCAQGYYLNKDDREKSRAMVDLRDSVKNLQNQTLSLMNAIQLQATLNDFKHLEGVLGDDFTHLEQTIQGTKHVQKLAPPQPPPLPPAVVEHIRIVQRRAASSDPNAKYGLQVVMQTDTTIQPVAFRVEFDQEISNPEAFIVGEGAYTMFGTAFSNDHKAFLFSFHTPAFTPNSSLIVAVQSKYDVRVVKVEKIQPLF